MNNEGNEINPHIVRQPLRATIISRQEIARDTIELVLQPSSRLAFTAGQYVWIVLPRLLFPDPKGKRRAFSIANSPQDEKLTFVYRNSPSGYKKTLLELPIGSDVEILGPFGFLTLEKDGPVVCIAGGTGLMPFVSILTDLTDRNILRNVTVFVSNPTEERVFYTDKLQALSEKSKQFRFTAKIGRLTWEDIENQLPRRFDGISWYIAGTKEMVEGMTQILLDHGIPIQSLHFDQFYGVVEKLPPEVKQPSELEKFKLAVENSTDHIVITDSNGIIKYANHAAEVTTGFTVSEMVGHTPRLWGGAHGPGIL